MKPGPGNQITLFQYILIIHSVQMGVGLIPLPTNLARSSGTDGWIVLIISWIISVVSSLLIVQIMKKHPNGTIIDLISHYFGKWAGKVSLVVFSAYFLLFIYLVYHRMALLLQNWIMQQTSIAVTMLLFLIPIYMVTKGGFRIIGRYSEILLFLSAAFLAASLYLFKSAHWIHLLPILKTGWMPIFKTVKSTIIVFLGFEMAFFLYPYLEKKNSASLGIFIANSITFCAYMLYTLLAFLNFAPDEITQYHNTLISLFKIIEFRFIERFDILVLSVYLLIILNTLIPMLYATVICFKQLGIKGEPQLHILLILLVMVTVTRIWNPSWNDSMRLNSFIQQFGIVIGFVLPALLWGVLALLRAARRVPT